jgi:ATP-dependent DNA ligase
VERDDTIPLDSLDTLDSMATRTAPPFSVTPVQPTQTARPFHREGWVYEENIDGSRVLVYKEGGQVRLISRHAKDLTARFPELAEAIANLRPETLALEQAAGRGLGLSSRR